MAAQNPALTQLLTALNAAPHPTMGTDFFAHVGSHMALARTIPPAWFPKTGSATEAQIGGLIAMSLAAPHYRCLQPALGSGALLLARARCRTPS